MKKECAVFTIVKNESYFLPIWLKHFKKFFNNEDIYILDHQSSDGSTKNLDVNTFLITNDLTFDHQWLTNQVEIMQEKLLEEYQCVLFCEVDELIYTVNEDFNNFIKLFLLDPTSNFVTVRSHELIQDLDNELPITEEDLIFENRNKWFHWKMYDKTLLSKIPLKWVWGFHDTIGYKKDFKYELFLVHLHRFDFELMLKRHTERSKWKHKNDGGGQQNLTDDRNYLLNFFKNIDGQILIDIPIEHKRALKYV